MVALIFASILATVSLFCLWLAASRLNKLNRWATFGFVIAAGVALVCGIKFGAMQTYLVSPKVKFVGLPIPSAIFALEGDVWVDYVHPPLITFACMIANALFPLGLMSVIWWVAASVVSAIRRRAAK